MGRDRRRLLAHRLDKAHRLAQQRHVTVEWILADVTTYQPPPSGFDLVTILYLQLPAEPLAAALANATRALAPSGTLLVVGHDTTNLTHGAWKPILNALAIHYGDRIQAAS